MSQNDDFENAQTDSAEQSAVLKGHDFSRAEDDVEPEAALQAANTLDSQTVLYQGTTSVVPQGAQNETGASAPENRLSIPDSEINSAILQPIALEAASGDLSASYTQPEEPKPARIPHLGHLGLLSAFLLFGFVCMMVPLAFAMLFHWGGVSDEEQMKTNVYFLLGSELLLYVVAFVLSVFLFPLFWKKSFFAGIHWRGRSALSLGWRLPAISFVCFLLAIADEALLPGPKHAPIEDLFRTPSAAWMMFAFGVAVAPFFEEIFFRGFLLPTLATAWDWCAEKLSHLPARPLDADGHPQWSIAAMIFAAIPTSLLFALMHAEQQGHSLGPFLLLVTISLILCAVRLKTRSLAASTLVHAGYNFLIFFIMAVSTDGFQHMDKLK
jgi:hypothetical protein